MALRTTPLLTILNRMNRWQTAYNVEEQYKVDDLDEALRTLKRNTTLPWAIKKGTLKVFPEVLTYPVASDHDEIIYLDDSKQAQFFESARFRYTSLQEFFENPDDRNDLAEIWEGGQRYLGVRFEDDNLANQVINDAEDVTDFTVTSDATTATADTVIYKEGSQAVRISIVDDTGVAGASDTFTGFVDSKYKSKYYFRWVYLDAVPTSIELRYGVGASNYLSSGALTTQFAGQALKADDWNLLAFDLNTATATGTVTTASTFAYENIIFTGAATGEYRLDTSYIKEWTLMDYWYASIYNIVATGSQTLSKEQFKDNNGAYEITDELVGDTEWADVIMYEALVNTITDMENSKIFPVLDRKRQEALEALAMKYPSMDPNIITQRWRFASQGNLFDNTIDSTETI